ncbi:hypothetical protein Anas_05362 [Armadillidium nasatum]|uniref:GRIP domain-containing protein n=1 Tax=Armadillidium nasatum TaxID=96803 RepID=A0A5N5T1M1_9CRUS|nr:hypothetical protein Anas_05362 [Armadillidium nasatum]
MNHGLHARTVKKINATLIKSCRNETLKKLYQIKNYEERLSEVRKRNEEERRIWKAEALEMALRKDQEMKAKMEALTSQNYKEKKELERLTRVAANAFKSGSESVDLLRDQVAKQRLEMEETRRKHQKEVEELKALLEVKRRKGRGGGHSELRNAGGSLEDSAEFEYLRNILYQYMIGKETQTLAKVLCAVVKFNKEQQSQIIDHEDRKQSLVIRPKYLPKVGGNKKTINFTNCYQYFIRHFGLRRTPIKLFVKLAAVFGAILYD